MKERNTGNQKIMKVKFIVPGPPVAKQRPRLGKGGRVYTPNKTKNYESLVAYHYKGNPSFKDQYLKIEILFKFEVPKSYSKKKRSDALNGILRPQRADIDNYIKSILDGLNKVAWEDDRMVCVVHAEKVYAEVSETIIKIENISK